MNDLVVIEEISKKYIFVQNFIKGKKKQGKKKKKKKGGEKKKKEKRSIQIFIESFEKTQFAFGNIELISQN
jgi:hypothetical protein